MRHLDRRADGARALSRTSRATRVQHGGDGPAPGRASNGVSKLHGEVSRRDVPAAVAGRSPPTRCRSARSPTACTPRTWVSSEMNDLLTRVRAARVGRAPEPADWDAHRRRPRRRAVAGAGPGPGGAGGLRPRPAAALAAGQRRERDRRRLDRRGARPARAHHRLRPPLRHLQAGHAAAVPARAAARPAAVDPTGRAVRLRRQGPPGRRARQGDDPPDRAVLPRPGVRHRIVFVEDYDIAVARMLYQGCDVWLNTPRRPHGGVRHERREGGAERAALNCSILDGWWDECSTAPTAGRSRRPSRTTDLGQRDQVEADSLFELLERQIVPLFYDRSEGRVPRRWVRPDQVLAALARPAVVAAADGARLRRASCTSRSPGGRRHRRSPSTAGARAVAGPGSSAVAAAWPAVPVRESTPTTDDAVADLGAHRHGHRGGRPRLARRRRRRRPAPPRPGRSERRARSAAPPSP